MNDLGKVQRTLQRALSEMTDAWVSIRSNRAADLQTPLDTWVGAVNADLELGEVMHTTMEGAGPDRIIVGFCAVQPPKQMRSVLADLFEIVESIDPDASIERFRESEYKHEKTEGSVYIHASVRWRADAYERQQARLADPDASGKLVLADADLDARAGLVNALISWALGSQEGGGLRYWAASQSFNIEVSRGEAEQIFRWAASRDVSRGTLQVVRPGHWSRRVVLEYRGGGVLCEEMFERERPAATDLVRMSRERLGSLAPWVESAGAFPSPISDSYSNTVIQQHMNGRDIPFHSMGRMLLAEPRKIADAFPVLHLGPEYAGRIPNGDGYSAGPISDGWILEHEASSTWFDATAFANPYQLSTPPALSNARAELDPLLAHEPDVTKQKERLNAWRRSAE